MTAGPAGTMRFGLSILGLVQQPEEASLETSVDNALAFVREAEACGYDYLVTGQHYLTEPYKAIQPLPLLARLIPESGDMQLFTTLIAPLHNPVDLAETWASMDVLSGGRVGLCLGLGYRDVEYAAFGVDPGRRVRYFRDVVETLRALWTEDSVTRDGVGFSLDGARCTVRPLQSPHPPLWIAANADPGIRRAARWGLPWNINPHARYETIAGQVELYRDEARAAGHEPTGLPLQRELYCAPTTEEARAVAGPYLAGKYAAYGQWGQDKALPGDEDFAVAIEELAADRFIVGDPDACAAEVARYRALGVERMHLRMVWPGMPLELALASLRLFADEVIPRFR